MGLLDKLFGKKEKSAEKEREEQPTNFKRHTRIQDYHDVSAGCFLDRYQR